MNAQQQMQALLNLNNTVQQQQQDIRNIKIFNATIVTTRQYPEADKIASPTARITYFDNSQIQTSFTFNFLVSHLPATCRHVILGLAKQQDVINYIHFSKSEQAQQHETNFQLQYIQLGSVVNDPSNVSMVQNALPFFAIKRKEYFWIKVRYYYLLYAIRACSLIHTQTKNFFFLVVFFFFVVIFCFNTE